MGSRLLENAEWIWPISGIRANAHILFRYDLVLGETPKQALLEMSVESAALLFINGKMVHRYTSLNYPHQQYVEQRLLDSHHFKKGKNEIAVLAWWRGLPSGASTPKDPGLIIKLSDGTLPICTTSSAWKYMHLDAWYKTELRSKWFNLDCIEYLDHRLLPANFPHVNIDSDLLKNNPRSAPVPGVRYIHHQLRPFPLNQEIEQHNDWKLLHHGEVRKIDHEEDTFSNNNIDTNPAVLMSHELFDEKSIIINQIDTFPLRIPEDHPCSSYSFVFHSQKYRRGYPSLCINTQKEIICDIAWHEQLTENRIENAKNHVYTCDRHILRSGMNTIRPLDWTAGHYLQITLRSLDENSLREASAQIEKISFFETFQDLPPRCIIHADNKSIQKIIDMSLQAARMCMLDNIMDCPWRERRQWIGDAQRIGLINHYCFRDTRLLRAVLKQHAQLQTPNGALYVCQPLYEEFPAQSFDYLHALREYEHYTGDVSLVNELETTINTMRTWYQRFIQDNGLFIFNHKPSLNWIDNTLSPITKQAGHELAIFSMNLRYLQALNDFHWYFQRQDNLIEAATILAEIGVLRQHIINYFYDYDEGLFLELGVDQKESSACYSELGHAIAAQLNLLDDGIGLFSRWQQGYQANDQRFISATPYGKWQTLRMFGEQNRKDELMQEIMTIYQDMIDADSDTIWEGFAPGGSLSKMSLCHGWGGTPVVALLRYIAEWHPRKARENEGDKSILKVSLPNNLGELIIKE